MKTIEYYQISIESSYKNVSKIVINCESVATTIKAVNDYMTIFGLEPINKNLKVFNTSRPDNMRYNFISLDDKYELEVSYKTLNFFE